MAIPHWTWTAATDTSQGHGSLSVEPLSERFSALANPIRLNILLAFAHNEPPITYGTLRNAVDIDDKGRLNYHVRQLRGQFIQQEQGGYQLTENGQDVIELVLEDSILIES